MLETAPGGRGAVSWKPHPQTEVKRPRGRRDGAGEVGCGLRGSPKPRLFADPRANRPAAIAGAHALPACGHPNRGTHETTEAPANAPVRE